MSVLHERIAKFALMFLRLLIILLSRFFLNLRSVIDDREKSLTTASDIRFSADHGFGGSVVFGAEELEGDPWAEEVDEGGRNLGALDAEEEIST